MARVDGEVAPGFEPVRDAFTRNFDERGELGAAVAAYVDGAAVVDLWGGDWDRDTIVHTFSVTKPLAAFCILLLWERGRLDLDAPVVSHWPEFGAAGKEGATVRHVLAHQAGLIALRDPQPTEAVLEWPRVVELLQAEPPWWTPGTQHGEHAYFYGHLVGELVRRVDGRTLGDFFRDEIARPWGLDFHIGVRGAADERVATLVDAAGAWQAAMLAHPRPLYRLALDNPPGPLRLEVVNSGAWRRAEIPALNGYASARAVARFYAAVAAGGAIGGVRLVRPETVAEALRPQAEGPDVLLERDVRWSLGFQLDGDDFGMGGIGGSFAFGNSRRGLGFAYVTSRMGTHDRAEAVETALLRVLRVPREQSDHPPRSSR